MYGGDAGKLRYYVGQLDFFEQNRDREGELDAENERLYRALVDRCQPKAWKFAVAAEK